MIIKHDECLSELKLLDESSIDSLITDPPAGISFMNKEWDKPTDFIKDMTAIYKECLRVLKPGAHGLVWAIPRTSHWTATALEQAGFEIRDVIVHLFGTGFPKSKNCGNGIGTALKPASEHWILVRKPLSESTVAKNVLKHGTGGINIDDSRIGYANEADINKRLKEESGRKSTINNAFVDHKGNSLNVCEELKPNPITTQGRFPSNLVFSHNEDCELVGTKEIKGASTGTPKQMKNEIYGKYDDEFSGSAPSFKDKNGKETVDHWQCTEGCAVKELDEQSGTLISKWGKQNKRHQGDDSMFGLAVPDDVNKYSGDSGGASRFFYCAKASKKDRGEDNKHPTVKNTKLMEYLIKLITPPNGIILDPFMGSGSTGIAAKNLGFDFVGIEKEDEYFKIAERRINPHSVNL